MDCKITIDDNAEYRQQKLAKMIDRSQTDHLELRAAEANLNYISLDGDIGCMGKAALYFVIVGNKKIFKVSTIA